MDFPSICEMSGENCWSNHYSAMSPIKSAASECGIRTKSVSASLLFVTYTGWFLETIALLLAAAGALLSRLAPKIPTCLILSIHTGSSQELHWASPEQKNAEGQCLVGGKS